MKAAVNPAAPAEASEEGGPRPAASDAAPMPTMPVSAGQQHVLTFQHTLEALSSKDGRLLGRRATIHAAALCSHTSSKAMPDFTGCLPGISGGLQSLLLDPSTLSSLYGAMGTSSGALLALSQLPGINMDAVQVLTSHPVP